MFSVGVTCPACRSLQHPNVLVAQLAFSSFDPQSAGFTQPFVSRRSSELPLRICPERCSPSPLAAASLVQFANSAPMPASLNDPKASHYQLACLLWRVKCDEGLILHLCGERGMESISDFAIFYILESREAKLAEELARAGPMDNPLQIARLRSAWQLARAELSKAMGNLAQAHSLSSSSDLDDPLSQELEAKRAKSFGEAYDGFSFEADSMPLARIIGRAYHELSSPKRSISTIP